MEKIKEKRKKHALSTDEGIKGKTIFKKKIIYSAALSMVVYILLEYIFPIPKIPITQNSFQASQKMAQAILDIREHLTESNQIINNKIDPNLTGLIGSKQTALTTSLGHPETKRTTTNPNFAGLIVYLLTQAGVQKGDKVAIGSSASFPALMIASVCAVEAMGAIPIIILSLGSSSYGANNPEFNLLDIYDLLLQKGIFSYKPAAASLGGEDDAGKGMDTSLKQTLINQIKRNNIPVIFENDFRESVKKRLHIYKREAGEDKVAAFINCGGNVANLGTSSMILQLKPGLINKVKLPEKDKRGVLYEMTAEGIPCLHLLYIRGLVQKYNLQWDSVPLPQPQGYSAEKQKNATTIIFLIICLLYLALIGFIFYK